jgi:hypothetical protein
MATCRYIVTDVDAAVAAEMRVDGAQFRNGIILRPGSKQICKDLSGNVVEPAKG